MDGEGHHETSTQLPGEGTDEQGVSFAGSGWTTTKQAAKVLGVSRRSVQGYIRRGLLEARHEGEGVNKRFFVSIDSLNELSSRRRHEAAPTAHFAEDSSEAEHVANFAANAGESLRHAIDRLEARTEEATELRVRLELTERAESTLREELVEERRRREQAEREREDLRRELEALRESPVSPGPSDAPYEAPGGSHATTERPEGERPVEGTEQHQASTRRDWPGDVQGERSPWWRRMFGGR